MNTRLHHVHRIGYSFGSASLGFAESALAIFYLFYLTNVVGIGAGLAGAVFALPKVWDTFVDPVVGTWVDRQATRVRKRWPFVLVSGLLLYAAFVGMFSIPNLKSQWSVAGTAFALLIAFSTARTVFGICQLSVSTEIAADETQLSSLYSLTLTVYTVVSLVGGSLPPLLVTWFGGGHMGYSLMAIFGAAMSCVFLVAYAVMTKSVPVQPVSERTASQSLFNLFRATIKNSAFVALLAYYVVLCICTAIISSFLPYLNLYILHGNDTKLAVLSGVFNLTNIIGFPLAPLFVRRYGARLGLKVGNLIMIATFVALFGASYFGLWTNWIVIGAGRGRIRPAQRHIPFRPGRRIARAGQRRAGRAARVLFRRHPFRHQARPVGRKYRRRLIARCHRLRFRRRAAERFHPARHSHGVHTAAGGSFRSVRIISQQIDQQPRCERDPERALRARP